MNAEVNILNWFDIPVTDMPRARKFYSHVFQIPMEEELNMGDMTMTFFPYTEKSGKLSGALALSDMHKPSKEGVIVYLNCNPEMDGNLNRVEEAGGMIVLPKTSIGSNGFMALIIDSEGNQIGLHSNG